MQARDVVIAVGDHTYLVDYLHTWVIQTKRPHTWSFSIEKRRRRYRRGGGGDGGWGEVLIDKAIIV